MIDILLFSNAPKMPGGNDPSAAIAAARALSDGVRREYNQSLPSRFSGFLSAPVAPLYEATDTEKTGDYQLIPCAEGDPETANWSVYGLYAPLGKGGELLADCTTKAEAHALALVLTGQVHDAKKQNAAT